MSAIIDDTYAEAFKSIYSEILITAINKKWLEHAVNAATGNASSSILCVIAKLVLIDMSGQDLMKA